MKNYEAFIKINHSDNYVPSSRTSAGANANASAINPAVGSEVVFKDTSSEDNVPEYTLVTAQEVNLTKYSNNETPKITPLFFHEDTWNNGFLITNQVKGESSKYSKTSLIKISNVSFHPNSTLSIDYFTIRYIPNTGDIDSNSPLYLNYSLSIDWSDLNERLNKLAPLEKIDLSDNFYKKFFGIKENDHIPSDVIHLLEITRKGLDFIIGYTDSGGGEYLLNKDFSIDYSKAESENTVPLGADEIHTDNLI